MVLASTERKQEATERRSFAGAAAAPQHRAATVTNYSRKLDEKFLNE
jgi:hypothetical protein